MTGRGRAGGAVAMRLVEGDRVRLEVVAVGHGCEHSGSFVYVEYMEERCK